MRHKYCGSHVYIDVSNCFNLLAEVSTVPIDGVLQTVRIHVNQLKKKVNNVEFICTHCNKTVEIEHLLNFCRNCGNRFPVSEIYVPKESNGSFCKECFDEMFDDEDSITLDNLLSGKDLFIV